MIWVVKIVLPLIVILTGSGLWMKYTRRDPALPSLVGILLIVLYIGFLIGLLF